MKIIFKTSITVITICLAACSTTSLEDKPDVQVPLKLAEATETMRHVCGSYGCDDELRKRCEGADFKILNQNTLNQYQSRKNNVTGGFSNTRAESVSLIFKCLIDNETSSAESE